MIADTDTSRRKKSAIELINGNPRILKPTFCPITQNLLRQGCRNYSHCEGNERNSGQFKPCHGIWKAYWDGYQENAQQEIEDAPQKASKCENPAKRESPKNAKDSSHCQAHLRPFESIKLFVAELLWVAFHVLVDCTATDWFSTKGPKRITHHRPKIVNQGEKQDGSEQVSKPYQPAPKNEPYEIADKRH